MWLRLIKINQSVFKLVSNLKRSKLNTKVKHWVSSVDVNYAGIIHILKFWLVIPSSPTGRRRQWTTNKEKAAKHQQKKNGWALWTSIKKNLQVHKNDCVWPWSKVWLNFNKIRCVKECAPAWLNTAQGWQSITESAALCLLLLYTE